MTKKKPLIVIVGPTAVGKTAASIQLAKHYNGEVISGDSMQVYREMDIGTAKITEEEMDGVPHHMINIKQPDEPFSVADFQSLAKKKIDSIHQQGKIPFIVGGTGLYVNAVIYDYHFSEVAEDSGYRERLDQFAEEHGNIALHQQLKSVDLQSYQELHPNNRRRVIRALEVYHVTGKPLRNQEEPEKSSPYDTTVIGLTMERELLYERINQRVDAMIEAGLIEEVKRLSEAGYDQCQSMQAIGYKEILAYVKGEVSEEEAISQLKQNSRRFAKRQLTWFRNKMQIEWFDMTVHREKRIKEIHQFLKESYYS
ncbi:tRNA (adenosine(37)-N6)-dimethylallyltransferase MiaA [Salipaludibacillus keqinensis]|uniref:tRNA dimethylallyltransferase n=1 Tax=Salipaludibacillus keqinensis TaxID=2045207 RepID=A0A323TED7_9BACI|nr:tRNA (adenosine(37)-N6)-dimethylallyltransferase MiaA [Salipaludibacillus keqinensis]PYZ93060.1 tRNA (adenosine(37)-N6)-dimethylallyltransferase MiaA [Salipaludibacillus keqinensis]